MFAKWSLLLQVQFDASNVIELCGTATKLVMISPDSGVDVYFSSDYSVNRAGFNITFDSLDGTYLESIFIFPLIIV